MGEEEKIKHKELIDALKGIESAILQLAFNLEDAGRFPTQIAVSSMDKDALQTIALITKK